VSARRRWIGIRGQFLVLMGLAVLFVSVADAMLSARAQRSAILAERRLRGLSVLRSWNNLCRERLLGDESMNLPMWDFVDDLMKRESAVEEVFLLDTNGTVVMHNRQALLGTRWASDALTGLRRLDSTAIAQDGEGEAARLRFEQVVSASGKRLGYAVVAFSGKGIESGVRESIRLMAVASVLVGLLGIALASILVYQISRPIRLLVEGVRRFGDTFDPTRPETADFRIDFRTYNEIGDIRDSVNEMTAALLRNMRERERLKKETGELRVQATTDAMTGLYNKRQFEEEYPVIVGMAAKRGHRLSLMLLDMDRFKQLNDTLGHAAGDDALRDLADSIRATTGPTERPYRIGGDEFVIVAAGSDHATARAISERISSEYERRKSEGNPTSISFGIVEFGGHMGHEELLKAADAEMYRVKREKKAAR